MTNPRATAARNAVSIHAANPGRSRCRLYDGSDTGPEDRRCWLNPGHQCDCMTEGEARAVARPARSRPVHPLPNAPRPFAQSPKPLTHNQRKAARKRQKAARRGNRSK